MAETTAERTRPELPGLVEQVRALLVLQRYLTVLWILVALLVGGIIASNNNPLGPSWTEAADNLAQRILTVAAGLVPVAIALAVCGKLLWRGWAWVYVLLILAQAAVVGLIVLAVTTGYAAVLPALVYSALTAWILVDLFRPEVLRFFWTKR